MKAKTQFESENILMSILGHLVLFAIMFFSFAAVVERAKLVTPDRIEIIEVDLNNVKVTGHETKLYNTSEPEPDKNAKTEKETKTADVEPNEKIDIKSTTLVENETKKDKKEDTKKKEEKKKEDTPAPRKKHRTKVNREVLSLDRSMTMSVKDSVRNQMRGCWVIDTTHEGVSEIRLTAHLTMTPKGIIEKVWYESEARAATDPVFAYVLETVKSAMVACHKINNLPEKEYDEWREISLTFYPSDGTIK